jgi:uncharacterized RDD family membrane protein YckC
MQIHIRRGTAAYGPYTPAEVRTYLGDGRLRSDDEARLEGSESWHHLADLLADVAAMGEPESAPVPATAAPAEPDRSLPTPAGVPAATPAYEPGGLLSRFLAMVIDGLIAGALVVPAFLLWLTNLYDGSASDAFFPLMLLGGLAAVVYSFIKDGLAGGASFGKRATGLMVVHLATARPCTMGQSAMRTLVMALLNLVPYVGWLVEPIMVLVNPDRRRLGDRAAGTQVITAADYAGAGTAQASR